MNKKIEMFCEKPTGTKFREFPNKIQETMKTVAKYCVKNKKGNIKLANKILLYYKTINMSLILLNGLKAVFLGLKMLVLPELRSIKKEYYPQLTIYIGKSKSFTVIYEYDLPNLYYVIQSNDKFGLDADFSLSLENIKEFFITSFSKNLLEIDKIYIQLSEYKPPKPFYDKSIGLIWGNEECLLCDKEKNSTKPLSEKCKKLLYTERCKEHIRYKPEKEKPKKTDKEKEEEIERFAKPKPLLKDIIKKQSQAWQCDICLTMNPNSTDVCLVCREPKPL